MMGFNHHAVDDGTPSANSISSDVCSGRHAITLHLHDKAGTVIARATMSPEAFTALIKDTATVAAELGHPLPFTTIN